MKWIARLGARARFLMTRGLHVVPLAQGSKVPLVPFKDRRFTAADVQAWDGRWPFANLAIMTGAISGVVGIDTDDEPAEQWACEHLPPTPMMTRSAHGVHRFYRWSGAMLRNRIGIWTPGGRLRIDLKADGGLLTAPGSISASGVVYQALGPWPHVRDLPAFEPDWLPVQPPIAWPTRTATTGSTSRVERARRYVDAVPGAIEGQGGDLHTFQLACRLCRGFDLSDDEVLSLLIEWNARCVPPWSVRDLLVKVRNVRRYGLEEVGRRYA